MRSQVTDLCSVTFDRITYNRDLYRACISVYLYYCKDKEQIKESVIYAGYHSVLDEFTDPYLWMEDIPWFIRLVEYRAYEAASDIRAIEPLI